MKILFDCVYTHRPSICSTSYLVWQLIEDMMAWRDDTFFYVMYPPNRMKDGDAEFIGRYKDRVRLIPIESETMDRVSELFVLPRDLRKYLVPWNPETWDVDIVVSSRVPMLAHMVPHFSRYQGKKLRSTRAVFGLEEMPFLPFRDTIPWSDELHMLTLASYLKADGVLVNHQWMKKPLTPVAKDLLSMSSVRKLFENIHEVVPVKLKRLNLKTEMYKDGDQFTAAFVGRVTSTRNFQQVADLFRKQFSYPLGKNRNCMEFKVSTNSASMGNSNYGDISFIDMQANDRPKFYEFLKGCQIAVNLTPVEDFSLSTYETLMAGIPMVVLDKDWNLFLGPDYPFRVKSTVEAYAILAEFAKDYEKMYARFRHWEETWWKDYVEGPLNVTTGERLIQLIEKFDVRRQEKLDAANNGGVYHQDALMLTEGRPEFVDLTAFLATKDGAFHPDRPNNVYDIPLGRAPTNLLMKLIVQRLGYVDTNTPGLMRRVS